MDSLVSLLVATPTGFWANIIGAFEGFALNYALAIILLTICIKLLLSPLDLMNKKVSRDNGRMQAIVAPQLAKLQKQYGHDKATLNQKTSQLYKSSGYNIGGSCVVMLVYMALTLIIFITLFTSLNSMSSYKIEQQYLDFRNAYYQAYDDATGDTDAKTTAGQSAVVDEYNNRNSSFIWVQNVWLADNPWTNSIPTFDKYLSIVGDNVRTGLDETIINPDHKKYSKMTDAEKEAFEAEYNKIMQVLVDTKQQPNGYLITAILAIFTAFFSQYLMQRKMVAKSRVSTPNGAINTQKTNKIMLIILPVVMGLITLFYNAVFGFYIIAGQIVSLATFPLIDLILDKIYAKKDKQLEQQIKVDYRRK